ncbi:MAG: hypothetical protein ACLQFI_20450 [Methylocella sp.]
MKTAKSRGRSPDIPNVADSKRFFGGALDVLLSARHYPSGKTSSFAAHGAPLIVLFALFLSLFGQKKTFAESTSKIDSNGRTLLCGRANVLEVSRTETVRGLCLCLNDSWFVGRVRGSRFRAARERREDFAKADLQLRKSLAGYRCLPGGAKTSKPACLDSTTNAYA